MTNKKVISKNKKGKGKKKSLNIWKRLISFIKNHLLSILLGLILLIISIFGFVFYILTADPVILSINGEEYNKSDFMIYLYSAKYNYFENEDYSKDDLNVVLDEENNYKVKDFLKDVALSDIKTASAIKLLADKYNVSFGDEDLNALRKEKDSYIESLGGFKAFNKFLKDNNTTEQAYDRMSKSDLLYEKILQKIFGESKLMDLSNDEYAQANKDYLTSYCKIKQIILTLVDVNTYKSLDSQTVNQKVALADIISSEAKKPNADFDGLIKKYSENAINSDGPFDEYFYKDDLLSELNNEISKLKPGDVSAPIKTKYAIHIVYKEELDNAKLTEYLDKLREEKCINSLKEIVGELKIVYHKTYENIKVS